MTLKTMINNWSISRKLTTLVAVSAVATGLTAGISVCYVGSEKIEFAMADQSQQTLMMLKKQTEQYFTDTEKDLLSEATDYKTATAITQFADAWKNTENPKQYLQDVYIRNNPNPAGQKDKLMNATDGSYYSEVHNEYHQHFKNAKDQKGYYDIFLIDANGDVVYSVYKESDFATNLISGEWAASGLAKAFKTVKERGTSEVAFADFEAYGPSANAPAAFMLSPVFDANKIFVGAVAYQMPIDKMNSIFVSKYDFTSNYVVGQDGLLRSDPSKTPQNDILNTKAKIQNLNDFTGQTVDDQPGVSFTESLYAVDQINVHGVKWNIVRETNVDYIHGIKNDMQLTGIIISLITSVAVALVGFFMSRKFSRPIVALSGAVEKLAGGYAVNVPCKEQGDEIGSLARSLELIYQKAVESARIETAVEESRSSLMIADITGQVIYSNKTVREKLSESKKFLNSNYSKINVENPTASHLSDFHLDKSNDVKALLANLNDTYASELTFDNRYFDSTIRPVYDKSNNHVGFVSEWREKTAEVLAKQEADRIKANEEMIEAEIAEVIQSAASGNFQVKLNTNHDRQFIRSVATGINDICASVDAFFNELNAVVSCFAEGDLTKSLKGSYAGQFDDVKSNLNTSFKTLSETIKQIATVGNSIRSASSDITQGADDLSGRTESQAASIEQTVATMEEMSASVRNNANSAVQASTLAADTLGQAEEGSRVVAQAVNAMQSLENSSHRIAEIVSVIDSIASQTNLLALNAAVEAARAGEAGKGFAVVASEVRTLASRCSDAARDIRGLISGSNAQVADGVKLVNATGNALRQIVESVNEVSQTIAAISSASREQATGVEEISGAISQMDEMTQQNAALSDESAAAARSLSKEAEHLANLVQHFKTEDLGAVLSGVSKNLKSEKSDFASQVLKTVGKKSGKKDSFDDFGGFGVASGDDWSDL